MISIIVATDDDLLIGKKDSSNGMPWHNKEDLQHFKKTTLHQTILPPGTPCGTCRRFRAHWLSGR